MESNGIKINGIYQHFKGDYYRVVAIAHDPDGWLDKSIVIYHKCDENGIFKSIRLFDDKVVPQPFYRTMEEFSNNVRGIYEKIERFKFIKMARV